MSVGKVSLGDGYRPDKHLELGAGLATQSFARRGASMSNDTIRVLLADDHAMVREGLRLLLRSASDIAIVGEAADGATTVILAQRFTPHVVVLDLDMPGSDGA